MAERAARKGTRSRTKTAFEGSLMTLASGVMLPSASPISVASNARANPRRASPSTQRIHASDAHHQPEAGEGEDREEASPAEPSDAVPNLRESRVPQRVGEQPQAPGRDEPGSAASRASDVGERRQVIASSNRAGGRGWTRPILAATLVSCRPFPPCCDSRAATHGCPEEPMNRVRFGAAVAVCRPADLGRPGLGRRQDAAEDPGQVRGDAGPDDERLWRQGGQGRHRPDRRRSRAIARRRSPAMPARSWTWPRRRSTR